MKKKNFRKKFGSCEKFFKFLNIFMLEINDISLNEFLLNGNSSGLFSFSKN